MPKRKDVSGYKAMWLFVIFDLPVTTKKARKDYRLFRKSLLDKGFTQLQYSVYARFYGSAERARPHKQAVRSAVPPRGHVRIFSVTDVQYAHMESYFGEKRVSVEKKPTQMSFF